MGKGHQRARAALLQQMTNDLTGLELERARAINPLFLELLGQLGSEQEGANAAIGRVLGEGLEFDRLFPAEEAARIEADRQRSVSTLGLQDEDLLQRAIAELGGPSEESLGRIRGIADTQTQIGLSDLGRFRDDTFDSIRQRSAGRGLRPTDSPILTEFSESGEEFGRQAEQFVRGIRQRTLEQELAYPTLELGRITQASDLLNRRRQFESQLAQQAEQQRLGLAGGIRDASLGVTGQTPTGARAVSAGAPYAGGGGLSTATSLAGAAGSLYSSGALSGLGSLLGLGGGGAAAGGAAAGAGAAGAAAGGGGLLSSLGSLVGLIGLSDEREKEDIEEIDASGLFDHVGSYRWRYKDPANGAGPRVGLMAQEVEAVAPEAIFEDEQGRKWIDFSKLQGPLFATVASLHRRMAALEREA